MTSKPKETSETEKMNATTWIKVGEHSSPAVLKKTVAKLRAQWLDRYVFRICEKANDEKNFELHLKHR